MARTKQAAAKAAQPIPTEDAAPPVTDIATPAALTEASRAPDERQLARLPDMRELKSINLGPNRDSPRLRLQRGYRFNQMQIRSDQELPEAARDKLTAAGWTERPEEGIWTRQLPPRAKDGEEQKPVWPVVLDAERLFHDIANAIRADQGLPPVTQERGAPPR
jgi:hypothetical protein